MEKKMTDKQKQDYDYLRAKGFSHQVTLERLGLAETTTPLHQVYGNHSATEFIARFYGATKDDVLALVEAERHIEGRVSGSTGYARAVTLSDDQLDEAMNLHQQQLSWSVIARRYGTTAEAIRKKVNRRNSALAA